jgi:heat shock protein HslJ
MDRRAIPITGLAILLAAALSACRAAGGPDPLDGTAWVLTSINGAAPLAGRPITLSFDAGAVQGSGGCNRYFGDYQVAGDSLTVTDLMWTEMACVEPGWMEQEADYLASLSAVDGFALADGQLSLLDAGTQTLTLESRE